MELPSVTSIESGGYALPGGRLLRRIEHAAPVSAVAFAPMGRDLVSGTVNGSILVTRDDGASRALQAGAMSPRSSSGATSSASDASPTATGGDHPRAAALP